MVSVKISVISGSLCHRYVPLQYTAQFLQGVFPATLTLSASLLILILSRWTDTHLFKQIVKYTTASPFPLHPRALCHRPLYCRAYRKLVYLLPLPSEHLEQCEAPERQSVDVPQMNKHDWWGALFYLLIPVSLPWNVHVILTLAPGLFKPIISSFWTWVQT